jgi:Protein kinase domain
MGNSRSKAAQANKNTTGAAWTTAGAVAADSSDRRALDDSSGGRSKRNHGKKNSPSSSSKKQGKTKREKKKNGSKIHRNSRSHQTNSLTRQDSYNKAILQHEQQQQQQQHLLPEVAVVIDHSMTTSTHSQPAVPATTTSSTPTSTTPATMNSAHPVGAVPQLQEEETIIIPRSMHASLVRSRDGEQQPVHQIYDIEHEIGHGSGCLCKVFRIQKKQEYIGGSSRPQNVVHGQNTCTTSNTSKQKWFIKTLQSLGTITIRAPVSPSSKKGGAGEDEQGDDSYSDDPWNSPDLRFLFRHHDSNNRLVDSSSSENDDSATSRDRQQRQQHLQQQLQTTTMTASTPVNDVATTTATTTTKASTTPSSSSLSATTTTTTVDVMSSTGNDTASITKGNSNNTKPMYFALKVINLVMVKEDKIAQLKNEVEILKTLDHPNIIQVYETFNTKRQVMMIMELCTGGDLHTRMPYTELQVAGMMRQILSAIRYIHARHIVHRGEFGVTTTTTTTTINFTCCAPASVAVF